MYYVCIYTPELGDWNVYPAFRALFKAKPRPKVMNMYSTVCKACDDHISQST